MLVFLFLIVPSMLLSFFAVRQGNLGFVLTALIAFFLWHNREPVSRIGLHPRRASVARSTCAGSAHIPWQS